MQKIPKQEYTTELKERAVKHVKEEKSIGLSAKVLGLVEQSLSNWDKVVNRSQAHWREYQASHTGTNGFVSATC